MKLAIITCLLILTGCCGWDTSNTTVIVQPPAMVDTGIQTLVDQQNAYRQSLGQEPLTQGLSCTLYTTQVNAVSIATATLTTVGSYELTGNFNQPNESVSAGLNILPAVLQPLYTSWFMVRCTGYLVVTQNGFTPFSLSSDDGSVLYIDGSALINNDGNHGVTTVSGVKDLQAELHSFRLDYMEGPAGNEALILNMNGKLLPAANLYH